MTRQVVLDNRSVALVVGNGEERSANVLREICERLAATGEHAPAIARTPEASTDGALPRALASALSLRPTRTRMPMWRELRTYAEARYDEGCRLLLVGDDSRRVKSPHFDVLHLLTTVMVGHDLAIGIVLAGRKELPVRLAKEQHRALCSRVSTTLRIVHSSHFRQVVERVVGYRPNQDSVLQLASRGHRLRLAPTHNPELVKSCNNKLP